MPPRSPAPAHDVARLEPGSSRRRAPCLALGGALLGAALGGAAPQAQAGSGPWVLSPQDWSVYGGVEAQRISELALKDGLGDDSVVQVDDGIETTTAQAILSYGLRKRVELELGVPRSRVDANRPGGEVCASLGPKACATTVGFGVVSGRGKVLLVDELRGAPVSVAMGAELRLGQHTGPTRGRITNLGEGTTDLGAFVAVGRSGGLLDGSWSAHLDAGWRWRSSNLGGDADPLPASELVGEAELFAGAQSWWSLGPTLSYWERPQGLDFGEGDLTDIDRFGALNGRAVRVGGKVLLRSPRRTTLVLSGSQTVAARNNPRVLSYGVGLAFYPERRAPPQGG